MTKIQDIPFQERPREKIRHKGGQALSDLELLAVLIGSGNRTRSVMTIAADLLRVIDTHGTNLSVGDLCDRPGIGMAKAALIVAALEFARRRIHPQGVKIAFPTDVYPLIRHLGDRRQEHFICVSLNGANEVIAVRTVSVGLVNRALVHPREVFADPITDRATAVVVAHNHPSGSLEPSPDDLAVTQQLKAAGAVLGIKLLDHIVFNQVGYLSLLERGHL
jgi:DNA repair protein RadC